MDGPAGLVSLYIQDVADSDNADKLAGQHSARLCIDLALWMEPTNAYPPAAIEELICFCAE